MTEEEILRKKLDWLNENSYYGIMIDTEITSIVRNLIKRLEEATMHADCEFCIKRDICTKDVPKPCNYRYTEEEHIADQASDIYGHILAGMYLPKTYQNKKEDNKMKPTSVWEIENIDEISITQDGDEISLLLKNRDDITKITLTGDAIKNHNDNFITTLKVDMEDDANTRFEQEQKIRELKEELGEWKKEASDCLKAGNEVRREKNKEINNLKQQLQQAEHDKRMLTWKNEQLKQENENLKKELALEKAANEAQHKFIREYAGKDTEVQFNYAIDDTEEVSYVIVEKRRNIIKENEYLRAEMKRLREENKDAVAESLKYIEINNKLRDENEELKYQLRDIQATKEVVEEKLNTRDNVNHPSHYTGRYECIDVMQDVFGDEATNDFCLCNAFKYIWRARKKNGLEDVKKAVWYINKYIEEAEKDGVPKGK